MAVWSRRSRSGTGPRPIIITGGGTAGHTNPGIAVAQALAEGGMPRGMIHFIGGARGNEGTLVGEAGFSIDLLPGRGIQRKPTIENIGSVLGLLAGFVKGFAIVAKRRPQAVLCLGGYAAFAASAAAVILRIPLVITEQNARANAVNRLFGRFAEVCALPFPDTDLPKGVLTGNPIRATILRAVTEADPHRARGDLIERYRASAPDGEAASELGDRTLIAVWAGSLGATRINSAVRDLVEIWAERDDVAIYHVVGRRDWAQFGPAGSEPARPAAGLQYLRVEYEDEMPDLLVAADFAVCRAGASTVTELAVAGLPAVLVPYPSATRNHQLANSAELDQAGGAIVVADQDVTGAKLAELLGPIVVDGQRRSAMAAGAASVARPNAARDVAELLLNAGGSDRVAIEGAT
ncbi:MAG: UDP-N-acetylglucosamine--N-acetylmuramyl-(pentapeptide) pyrophosphoryl-undecaprenol N-acetylglucosamine transferase [Acidimicrobiales bacterium]